MANIISSECCPGCKSREIQFKSYLGYWAWSPPEHDEDDTPHRVTGCPFCMFELPSKQEMER
jgi:hypothetical protein